MKYQIASLAVMALLTSSTQAGKRTIMSNLAQEDDRIDAGQSEWNDVGYIQTTKGEDNDDEAEDPEDEANIGIGSLNK